MIASHSLFEAASATVGEIRLPASSNVRKELSSFGRVKIISITQGKKFKHVVIQTKDYETLRKVAVSFSDDFRQAPQEVIEDNIEKIKLSGNKFNLIFSEGDGLSYLNMKMWLRKNCNDGSLLLRGRRKTLINFNTKRDFALASLRLL